MILALQVYIIIVRVLHRTYSDINANNLIHDSGEIVTSNSAYPDTELSPDNILYKNIINIKIFQ